MPNADMILDGTCKAGEDLTEEDLYKFVELTDEREVKLADTGGSFAAGDRVYGVLQSYGEQGEAVGVAIAGITAVRLTGTETFTAGALIEVANGGLGTESAEENEDVVMAVAREDGDDSQVISCALIPGGDTISAT